MDLGNKYSKTLFKEIHEFTGNNVVIVAWYFVVLLYFQSN